MPVWAWAAEYRRLVREVGITPLITRRREEHGSGLGMHRWVVKQTFALLHWFGRLRIRWEAATTSTKPSCAWRARSSASAG
jgi:hypothetical protein